MSLRHVLSPAALATSGATAAGLALAGASAALALPAAAVAAGAAAVAAPRFARTSVLEGDEIVELRGRTPVKRLRLSDISSLEAQPSGPAGRTWFVSDAAGKRIRIQSAFVADRVLDRLKATLGSKDLVLNSFARAYLSDRSRIRR